MDGIPHYSQSQANTWSRCQEQWRRRYVEGDKRPPGIAAHVGKGIHFAAEQNGSQKIDSHEDMDVDDLVEVAVECFKNNVHGDGFTGKGDIGEQTDKTAILTEVYAEDIAPTIQPVSVEEYFEVIIGPADAPIYTIVGYIDVRDDRNILRDYKSSGSRLDDGTRLMGKKGRKKRVKTGTPSVADSSFQLSTYAMSDVYNFGKLPGGVAIDSMIATANPYAQKIESTRSMADVKRTLKVYSMLHKQISFAKESGAFCPTTDAKICNWCGHNDTCPYARGKPGGEI